MLSASGFRLTASRRAILAVLSEHEGHLNSTQIMEEARGYHSRINLASTYRNLALFTRIGLVRPLYIGETQPLYTRNDQPHHHAICLHCNKVQEFEECAASGLERMVEEQYGFRSSSHLLEIYGLCKTCQEAPTD